MNKMSKTQGYYETGGTGRCKEGARLEDHKIDRVIESNASGGYYGR